MTILQLRRPVLEIGETLGIIGLPEKTSLTV